LQSHKVLAADPAPLVGAIQQPVTLKAKEWRPVTILNPASWS